MLTSPGGTHCVQIVAKRVTIVRSKCTRSGVAALDCETFEPESTRSAAPKPRSAMIALFAAAAAAWSLLALFGHY
jgi:hypothetical protein